MTDEIQIHLFAESDRWVVAVGDERTVHADRGSAFAMARDLARTHSPSRLVQAPPTGATNPGGPGAAGSADPDREERDPFWADDPGPSFDGDWSDEPFEQAPPRRSAGRPSTPSRADGGRPAPTAGRTATSGPGAGRREPSRPASPKPPPKPPRPARPRPEGPPDWARLAGPPELGRSLLLLAGHDVPAPWRDAERVAVDADALAVDRQGDPSDAAVDLLAAVRGAYLARTPVVYELAPGVEPPAPQVLDTDVWSLPADHELVVDALWHLLTVNTVDARDPTWPRWAWGEEALDAGGRIGAEGDLVLDDGRVAWCDGGPLDLRGERADDLVVVHRVAVERDRLAPWGTGAPRADLAPDQLEAVAEPTGRSRIIAPAGSGKTRVLTERARHLLRERHVPGAALCLVAFNKRAQEEMRSRTSDLDGLQIQTLNALALGVLNGSGPFLARGERVQTIDERAVRELLGRLVEFPRRMNTDPAAAWLDALSAARLGLRNPTEVEADFGGDVDGFAELFPRYRRALRERRVVDFDEQIYGAIEVLLTEPDVRATAQRASRVLMVDEFQDLTPAHLLLIRLLAGPDLEVFGVGDDDQTIYGYSGASPDWLIDFDHWFPAATHHALEVNYRCPPPVVTAADHLLSHNRRRVPKVIRSGRGERPQGTTPDGLEVVHDAEPVRATVARVQAALDGGAAPADVAVLARVNTLLAPVQVALHAEGIPVTNAEGARFLDRTGVAAALAWLRIAANPGKLRADDVGKAARRPGRSLSPRVIEWMGEQHDTAGLSRLAGRLSGKDGDKVLGFAGDVERLGQLATRARTARILEYVRDELGLDRAMQTLDAAHRGRNMAAASDDLRALIALGHLHPEPRTFVAWLRESLATPPATAGVQLSTVHRVKGLEWPHVVVHDASAGLFPHRLSTDVEEERRVFHVAITRGQTSVSIVADRAEPSLFVAELDRPAPPLDASATARDRGVGGDARRRGTGPSGDPASGSSLSAGGGRAAGGTGLFGSEASGRDSRAAREPVDLPAEVGLELDWGGYPCTITAIGDSGVTMTSGRAELAATFGSLVTVDGRPRKLAPPARPTVRPRPKGGGAPHANQALLDALKAWRSDRCRSDGVPAYVVANDKTLDEIAAVLPGSPAELLRINGIGATKLERYGDEILAVIDDHRPA